MFGHKLFLNIKTNATFYFILISYFSLKKVKSNNKSKKNCISYLKEKKEKLKTLKKCKN